MAPGRSSWAPPGSCTAAADRSLNAVGESIVGRYTAYQRRDLTLVEFLGQELDLGLDVSQRAKVTVATHDGHK